MLNQELRIKVDRLWEAFRKKGITNPLKVVEQITYMLFIQSMEGENFKKELYIPEICRWSVFSKYPREEMFQIVVGEIFPFIQRRDSVMTELMRDAVFEIPEPNLLGEVVEFLENLDLQTNKTKVNFYEYLLLKLSKSEANYGQFYTPKHVVNMIVEMMEPALGELILDPACGTGGFLTAAANFMREKSEEKVSFDNETFTGLDIDSSMLKISTINLLVHDIAYPNIQYIDALSREFKMVEQYDLVLTNPPFSGILDIDGIHPCFLKNITKTRRTELLFLALTLRVLRDGGRCAIIIPDGVLHRDSYAHIETRRFLVEENCLEAVVALPVGVFKPYASISTSILIFRKKGPTDKVWYYEMTSDGFTLDDKRNPSKDSDLKDVVTSWLRCKEEKNLEPKNDDKWFWVDKDQIRENEWNLSINQYKKIEYKETLYDPPLVILDRIRKVEEEIIDIIADLRGVLDGGE
ncbi:DNA methyltransferase [Peribacillus simplex]|nr:DNA methyltransferase [Peribacillus simplex]